MSHLAKLKLSPASPRSEVSPLDRKRLKLLQRLELQQQAAQAYINGEPFTEEVQRWVKHKDTGVPNNAPLNVGGGRTNQVNG